MTETQKRIKAYQAALPDLKERVLAVALLLVVSLTMMTSATFAWLTISRAPEVTGVSTTVAANGNLEIALATSKTAPGDSKVGDSSATEGQSVVSANVTWGNLVNLSDSSYGLDNLVLRPAQLNTTNLKDSPLYGAVYSEDGRIERLTSNFSYTSWVPAEGVVEGRFRLSNNLGVRAVSSTKREVAGFYGIYLDLKDKAVGDNTAAGNAFTAITQNDSWMTVLAKLMGIHMTATLNSEDEYRNAEVTDEELGVLIEMYDAFITAHELEAAAIAKQLNVQLYAAYGGGTGSYTEWTAQAVLELADSRFDSDGNFTDNINIEKDNVVTTKTIKIVGLQTFISDYNMLKNDIIKLEEIRDQEGSAKWTASGLKDVVNRLVIIDDCLVKKTTASEYKTVKALLKEFTDSITTAMGYLGAECDVVITNGVLKNFEQRTGTSIKISQMAVTAKMYVSSLSREFSANISANITTSATTPSNYMLDDAHADTLNTGADNDVGEEVAQDTYALAVDLWVRTNAASSYLTLEGNVLYDDGTEVVVTGKDANGNTVDMYTLSRSSTVDGSLYSTTYTLYQVELETADTFWFTTDGAAFALTAAEEEVLLQTTGTSGTNGKGESVTLYTFTRSETTQTEYSLYQVDGVWYDVSTKTAFTLNEGETPKQNGKTTVEGIEGEVDCYYLVRSNTQDVTYTLYNKTSTESWYNAETYNVFLLNDGEVPNKKVETVYTVIGYEGENRVWNGEDKSYISTDSTTQGSGSCYIYYADTPEDQARSLELLAAMNVAFIGYSVDENGNETGVLLATAKMDTEKYFAEGGRVTVPLVLSDGVVIGEDDDGNAIYGITSLQQNEATRITALVFLDGTLLGNENVLAASDIQGRLNIQFGSSQTLYPIDNEDLENDELRVSATVSKTSFDYDTATEPMTTTVTVNVDGDAPSTMTAFFIRQISSTQGSREEEMTFTKQADGTWTASYTFDSPGVYILRSVRMDGVDYDLTSVPTVTITGFTISSLTMSGDGVTGRNANIMTAANSGTVDLSLKFATNDVTKMPRTVQGRFLRSDGTAVNVNFTYNPTSGFWNGSATFLSSGDYTFEYLVLDGEYVELEEGLHQTASVTLGMRVAVYTTSPLSFKYLPSEMTANQKLLAMQVKILDNAGKEMQGLQGAKLVYRMQGSVAEMDTDLIWDAASGYYLGSLKAEESGGAGVWKFSYVTVGGNNLTNATTSPTFTLISPEPPSFEKIATKVNYQFKPDGDAYMQADLNYSASAKVFAVINGQEVEGVQVTTTNNVTTWKFAIPTNKTGEYSGKQDGYWTMEEIRIWDYYTADGVYIAYEKEDGTRDEPMVIDMADQEYTTKVVQTVIVSIPEDKSQTFTGNNFMESYTLSAGTLSVVIKDFEGKPIDGVSDVQMTFSYKTGTSQNNGGYTMLKSTGTGDALTNATTGATVIVALTDPDGDAIYTQSADATFLYAGDYETTFDFKVSSTTYSYAGDKDNSTNGTKALPANTPVITVKTEKPTVTVTGVSPTDTFDVNSHSAAASGGGFTKLSGVSNSFTDYYATVYIEYTGAIDVGFAAWRYYAEPSVELTLSGMPSTFENASITFNHPTAAYARTYTFTPGDGLVQTNEIGHANDPAIDDANPALYFAGEQTVRQITVKYTDSITFTVDLFHEVTINQPQYPPYATYASTATNGLTIPTTPGTSIGVPTIVNGELVYQITLPASQTWTEAKQTDEDHGTSITSGPTTTYQYTRNGLGNSWSPYKYVPYTIVTTSYQASVTTTTWTNTNVITKWKIGNTEYDPGAVVVINSTTTVTAVVSVTEGAKTPTTSTKVRTTVEVTTGAETTTKPSGDRVYRAPTSSDTGWVEQ